MTKKIGPVRRKYREFRIIQPEKKKKKKQQQQKLLSEFPSDQGDLKYRKKVSCFPWLGHTKIGLKVQQDK